MSDKALEIENLLSKPAHAEGVEIIDVQYLKEDGDMIARIFIDKDGGIKMSDCEHMSRIFGACLDESDVLSESYVLEVSSPGLNRVLKNEKSFKRFTGEKIRLRTFNPVNNQRNFLGTLVSFENGEIEINDVTNGPVKINFNDVQKANLEQD
jgi:ribosome maturation factor RimP